MFVEITRPVLIAGEPPERLPGEKLNLHMDLATLLIGLDRAKPLMGEKPRDLKALRLDIGIRPYDPNVYFHDKASLWDCRPDHKILIIRKYGGLGDIFIVSYLLNEIHRRFPDNPLSFANPSRYHDLFRGMDWLGFIEYEGCFKDQNFIRGGVITNDVVDKFDVVEDVSTPCHIWETLFKNWNFGFGGLLWRNRLDMWGNWIGVNNITAPKSCIEIAPAAVKQAQMKHLRNRRNVLLLCPMSALDAKDYPYFADLKAQLTKQGWTVLYVGNKRHFVERMGLDVLATQTNRELLALIGAADMVVTVDNAILHGAGIMGTPAVGIFNINDGKTYCKYYPNVTPVQTCDTPCIMLHAHQCQWDESVRKTCYKRSSVEQIAQAVRDKARPGAAAVKPIRRAHGREQHITA